MLPHFQRMLLYSTVQNIQPCQDMLFKMKNTRQSAVGSVLVSFHKMIYVEHNVLLENLLSNQSHLLHIAYNLNHFLFKTLACVCI